MKINKYQDLIVWRRSIELVKEVYAVCQSMPIDEKWSLISQIKRSSISIPSNIAEGFGRRNRAEFRRFLNISHGSACELETQLTISNLIYGINVNRSISLIKEIIKMLNSLTYLITQELK